MNQTLISFLSVLLLTCFSCKVENKGKSTSTLDPTPGSLLEYKPYQPDMSDIVIDRKSYHNKLYGFWLGQCIANWTGLVTEMDKIGNIGDIKTGPFYTSEDWGKPDQPNIWSGDKPSDLSPTIDFVFRVPSEVWGSDDDTDIEYLYQHLMYSNQAPELSAEQIRNGWLRHIRPEEENYLWVSNQKAFDLMKQGFLPPETSDPELNEEYEMIDAQLTTEIFGLMAPTRPELALQLSYLPIRTTARNESAEISEFYVTMHALASKVDTAKPMHWQTKWLANQAREHLSDSLYPAKMFDYVKMRYEANIPWEQTRDEIYQRYQVEQQDGYDMTSRNLYCNGCYAAGINFAASLVSWFYGEGDFKQTIKIGSLAGWDSDNPTATWGGLLGFMLGKEGIEKTFNRQFSDKYNIHRTRQNFPRAIDNFNRMAKEGVFIVDRVVQEKMNGGIHLEKNVWYIPVGE